MNNVWEQIIDILKIQLGNNSYDSWIAPLTYENFENGRLILSAPNRFIADFCEKNYKDDILSCLNTKFNDICDISICVANKCIIKKEIIPVNSNNEERVAEQPSWFLSSVLKEEWTFDNFVVDNSNEFTYKACMRIAEDPNFAYNPVFLYAGIGLGKTHLLHAIANHIAKTNHSRKVLYISARQFTNNYIKSFSEKTTFSFKEQFNAYDLLLIDDLQFIDGKKSTQEAMLHVLSELVSAGKQIVLAGNRSLSSLTQFDKNLKSQIISGLSLDMAHPSFDTRVKILESKQKLLGSDIESSHIKLIAKKVVSNVRELEGAYRRIVAYKELSGDSVTVNIIENVLKDMIVSETTEISAEEIIKKSCSYFEISMADLLSAKREKHVCYCRQIAMSLVKNLTKLSFPEIGKKFGNKDHASVMYSCKQIENRKDFEPKIGLDIANIKEALGF